MVRNQYSLISGIVLCALLLRAMIPVGFMPAPGRPFSLQICRAELFTFSSQANHAGGHSHFESCPFGSAPAAGPVSAFLLPAVAVHLVTEIAIAPRVVLPTAQADPSHRPRGPPTVA